MRKIEYQEQIVASVFTFCLYNFVFVFNSYFIFFIQLQIQGLLFKTGKQGKINGTTIVKRR